MRIARYDALTRPLTEVIGVTTIAWRSCRGLSAPSTETHLFGIRLHAPMSLGMMFLFYGMLAGMSDPARKLSEVFSRMQRGSAAADRIYQFSIASRRSSTR